MRSILVLVAIIGMLVSSQLSAEQPKIRVCENGVCRLIQREETKLPAAESLPLPKSLEKIESSSPTIATPPVVVHSEAPKPMRSVLVKSGKVTAVPVRVAANVVSKVREVKPVRRILGRLFRGRCN